MLWKKLKELFAIDDKYKVTDLSQVRLEEAEKTLCKINQQLKYHYDYNVISPNECIFGINCIMMAYINKYKNLLNK